MEITTSLNHIGGESETGKPKRCACKCRIIIVVVLAVLVIGAVCGHICHSRSTYSDDPSVVPSVNFALKPGLHCTVQLRRDALGAAANSPIPPFNKSSVVLEGRLIAVNDEAILLDVTDQAPDKLILGDKQVPRHAWIPKGNILFIDYYAYPD